MDVSFSSHGLRDLLVVQVTLDLAFATSFTSGGSRVIQLLMNGPFDLAPIMSLPTADVGFPLHEIAHKVVAVRFNQVTEFCANYDMFAAAIMSALIGFVFAAPGVVYRHSVSIGCEYGLVALVRPVTNLLLLIAFASVFVVDVLVGSDIIQLVGSRGLIISAFLTAFNMPPFGSLDSRTVKVWSMPVFADILALSIPLTVGLFLFVGF